MKDQSSAVTAPASALNDIRLHEEITAIDSTSADRFYAIDKLEAHVKNIPHVAISLFIFNENRLLLQQRATTKYHSAGLWANTVCSHPRWCESIQDCAQRRLQEELGFQVSLQRFGSIDYSARVGDLFENEHVHCFHGRYDGHEITTFNHAEVKATQWLTIPEILQEIESQPQKFTEWFKIYMLEHRQMINAILV